MKADAALSGRQSDERLRPGGRTSGPQARAESALDPTVPAVLASALEKVRADWQAVAADSATGEEVGRVAEELIREIGQRLDETGVPVQITRSVLARRVLALLRRRLLVELQARERTLAAADALRILQALERVAEELQPDWAQHFADRLAGPDGLEMVVEVAHDLRSPLTSILFLAETLQKGRSGQVNELQERQLGLVYSAAFGLSAMASDVIELARGGDRLVDLDPIPFSVADIFESVRDIVQPIAEEKGLEVRLVRPERDFRIGHPVALSRVLLNLTTNALKFTAEGYVEVTGTARGSGLVEFAVRDTGRGIGPQAMLTLYEPFRRRQKAGEYAFSGSGLGLSICRKLVEAMGAELQVETGVDEGTRFFFTLDLPDAGQGIA